MKEAPAMQPKALTKAEQYLQKGYAPGTYFNLCLHCAKSFMGAKRSICCIPCADKMILAQRTGSHQP